MAERYGHLSSRRFSEYLAGLLDDSEALRVEEHIAACRDCARTLQQEAILEMELFEAAAPPVVHRLPRVERAARWACAVMAAAAAILLVLADPAQYLQLDRLDDAVGPTEDVLALFAESVCMPDFDGANATCEEPITVAMATVAPETTLGFEAPTPSFGGGCWLDEQMIDPLCVTTDPLAG